MNRVQLIAQSLGVRMLHTPHGTITCFVPEFTQAEYKGLKSGIGKERRSSKHFGCKKDCCVDGGTYHPKAKQ